MEIVPDYNTHPLVIRNPEGVVIFAVLSNGTVHGDGEGAKEAGRIFAESFATHLRMICGYDLPQAS